MAIKAQDAIEAARRLIGTPYAQLDCINLIKKVIRTAPGGVKTYTTAGTNALWNSYEMSAKYKDLTERHEGIENVPAGAIPFKRDGNDYHHAGIATGSGTVIHSSSTQGGRGVVETPLTAAEGWNCWGAHRYIKTAQAETEEVAMYRATVNLESSSSLNLRTGPSLSNRVIGSIPNGATVEVIAEAKDWAFVRYETRSGYVAAEYLERVSDDLYIPPEELVQVSAQDAIIIDEAGNVFRPVGKFTVEIVTSND